MRRWEDWERSRLRKLRREERRRREMERAFPNGYNGHMLAPAFRDEVRSQYDGSDTLSIASTDDDQWGVNIGGYNEHHPAFPPPPMNVLLPKEEILKEAEIVGGADLEAMLEVGFDSERKSAYELNTSSTNLLPSSSSSSTTSLPRFQLQDTPSRQRPNNNYAPLARSEETMMMHPPPSSALSPTSPTSPIGAVSSGVGERQTHARKRSAGRGASSPPGPGNYGPLGPLDPGSRI